MMFTPLVDGLLYPSEDDRPFDVFDWGPVPGPARAVLARHVPAHRTVEEWSADAFFDPLRNATDAERFAALRHGLEAALAGLSAFRVSDGSAEVSVYLIGRTADGRCAGVHTVSIET